MSNVVKFSFGVSRKPGRLLDDRPAVGSLSATAKNGHMRKERREVWRQAEAVVYYWKVQLDLEGAVSRVQRMGLPEGRYHPAINPDDRGPILENYRAAFVRQLLTPAPDAVSVKWKQRELARGAHTYAGLKSERLERAIADDLEFLAEHPSRRSNSEAMASRKFTI